MSTTANTLTLEFERTIPASPAEVYDAWLDPKVPGTTWNEHDELLLDPRVGGFFYWLVKGIAHYGRFTKAERGSQVQYTWMSRYTQGEESLVTVTFAKQGEGTRMKLVHSGLPDNDKGRAHEGGWNHFVGTFAEQWTGAARKSG